MLKNTLIRSGNIRVRSVPLADFGRGNAAVGEDGLKVLRDAVSEKRDVVVAQVKAALAHIHENGLVRVRVHPSDLPYVEVARAALSQTPHGLLTVKLESDSGIAPGGCMIQTASLLIDATLDTQLLRLGEALRKREAGEA